MTVAELINKIGFKVKNEDVTKVNNTVTRIKDTANKVLGAIGVGLSLTALNGMVEEFGRINDQIRNSTRELGEQGEIQDKILAAAGKTRSTYQQTAKVVSDLVHENAALFGTIDEAITFNNAATMLFKTAGKTNEEIAGLMEAINKSFAKGYVDSETLSQLLERSPEAVELLNRTLGTTSDQLEKMASDGKFTVEDLKAAFVDNAAEIEANFSNVSFRITDAIAHIRDQFGLWLSELDETTGLTDTIAKGMVSGFGMIKGGLDKVRNGVVWLTDKFGGMENVLKFILILATSVFAAMNFGKIMTGLSSVMSMIGKINLKTVGIIALITLLGLVIEDVIHFLLGNDSLIGDLLTQAGVDCDALRETISAAWVQIQEKLTVVWEHIKTAGSKVWTALKAAAIAVFNGLQAFWETWGETIKSTLGSVFEHLGTMFNAFLDIVMGVADFIGAVFSGDWEAAWQAVIEIATAIWDYFADYLEILWESIALIITIAIEFISSFLEAALIGIKNVASRIWNSIKTFFSNILNSIKTTFTNVWNAIKAFFSSTLDAIKTKATTIWNNIKTFLSNAMEAIKTKISNIWESIKSTTSSVWESIKTKVSDIVSSVKSTVSSTFESLKSSVSTIWSNIKSAITTPIEEAKNKVKNVIDAIEGFFSEVTFTWPKIALPHFSISPAGWKIGDLLEGTIPSLSISWYRKGGILDGATIFGMMGGKLLGGGEAGKEAVIPLSELWKQMRTIISDGVSSLMTFLMPLAEMNAASPVTAGNTISNTSTRTILITNEFNQQFHGERAAQQKSKEAMSSATKDITGELARALTFT